MAITTTSFTPEPQLFPWSGLSDPARERSDVPRQEVWFIENFAAITAGGAGNEQHVDFTCSLPRNFSYALTDLSFGLVAPAAGSSGNNFEVGANVIVQDGSSTTLSNQFSLQGLTAVSTFLAGGKQELCWCMPDDCMPSMIFKAAEPTSSNVVLNGNMFNWSQNDGVYLFYLMARFLMFDYNQAYHWAPNTPTLTR